MNKKLSEIEAKLSHLDTKINLKINKINELFQIDVNKISNKYTAEIEANHVIHFNEHRDVLLARLDVRLKQIINAINISNKKNIGNLLEIINTNENIKEESVLKLINLDFEKNLYYYNCGSYINPDRILNKYYFEKPLDYLKVNKYFDLLPTKKRFKINMDCSYKFISLPFSRMIINVNDSDVERLNRLLVIDKDGLVLFSKEIEGCQIIKATSSSIYLFYNYSLVEVYDTNLKLSNLFSLNSQAYFNCDQILICNNELAISYSYKNILLFNVDSLKYNHVNVENLNLKSILNTYVVRLINFNKEILFFAIYGQIKFEKIEKIYIIDRANGAKLNKISLYYHFNHLVDHLLIRFDAKKVYVYDKDSKRIKIFSCEGKDMFLGEFEFNKSIRSIITNGQDEIVYNFKAANDFIEFDEY